MPASNRSRNARHVVLAGLFAFTLMAASAGSSRAVPGKGYASGLTTRIAVRDLNGEALNPDDVGIQISPDGRSLLMQTYKPLLQGDTNSAMDIYLQDIESGTVERISLTDDEQSPNGNSLWTGFRPAHMSADGRYFAFSSYATNMTGIDANGPLGDIFVRDRVAGTTHLVSKSSQGVQGSRESLYSSISDDGRVVAFVSRANLEEHDTHTAVDDIFAVFVHDLDSGETKRVSVISGGRHPTWYLQSDLFPLISGDGRYVTFEHRFPLDPTNPAAPLNDIYVHDRVTRVTERVSVASDGSGGRFGGLFSSIYPLISADGRYVAFVSDNTNLVPNDTNGNQDAFIHDRQTGRTERLVGPDGQQGQSGVIVQALSADGRFALAYSAASNLGSEDGNAALDIYRFDRLTGQVDLISSTPEGTAGDVGCAGGSMSSDGRYVVFRSNATNLIEDGKGGGWFLRDLGPAVGAGGISATQGSAGVDVSGWVRLTPDPLASPEDSHTDALPPGASNAGAELIGASITYRPEREDVRFQIDLAPRPHSGRPGSSLMPGSEVQAPSALTYGVKFSMNGALYEARAVAAPSGQPTFALFRCAAACAKAADLAGGIGTAGEKVAISIPLESIGATEGSALGDGSAYVAGGEQIAGPLVVLDEIAFPDREIPAPIVDIGLAPRGTPQGAVDFNYRAELVNGRFTGTLAAPGAGEQDVWARVCFLETCTASVTAVEG